MSYAFIDNGSVTSPAGFKACGVCAGLKRSGKADMAMIVSDIPARVSASFTANAFAAAPVLYDKQVVAEGKPVRAIVVNSGNANACTGPQGMKDSVKMAGETARLLGCQPEEVMVSSTGRIGVPMPMDVIIRGIESAASALEKTGGIDAAKGIMTTDTVPKYGAVSVEIGGETITIGGMTKGAGMIAPKMLRAKRKNEATMLAYVTTDAAVDQKFLECCLDQSLNQSFNRITVDGDTSTNDTFVVMANGKAGNDEIKIGTPEAEAFMEAFNALVARLAKEMVLDGEGVTRFVELTVSGAKDDAEAQVCAETIANSLLCKTAWFGADPNWGRILDAAGYSGVTINPDNTSLDYEGIPIVRNGCDAGTPERKQTEAINKREFSIDLDIGVGDGCFTIWTCDLTYEYVKINADYHT